MFLHFLFNIWGTLISPHFSYGNTPMSFVLFLGAAIVLTASGLKLFGEGMRHTPVAEDLV